MSKKEDHESTQPYTYGGKIGGISCDNHHRCGGRIEFTSSLDTFKEADELARENGWWVSRPALTKKKELFHRSHLCLSCIEKASLPNVKATGSNSGSPIAVGIPVDQTRG